MNFIQVSIYLITIVILVKLLDKMKNKRFYELLEQFPSFPTYPLIGNVHLLLGSVDGILDKMEKLSRPFDRVVYWIGPIPVLCLAKHDDIATVLTQSQDRETLNALDQWLGIGILNARYEEWKKSRKMFAPAFSSHMLLKYVQVFHRNALEMVERLKSVADTDEEVDVSHWMMKMSMDSIVENSIGIRIENSGKSGEEFCHAILICFRDITKRFLQPWLIFHHIYMIFLKLTGKIKLIEQLQYLPTKLLGDDLKKSESLQKSYDEGPNDENSSNTMLELLIKKGLKESGFSEIRVRDELLHMIVAATELTALTTNFLALMLAINQDIQQKVYEEVIQFTADTDELYKLTDQLIYLEQCIKETLRMFSPAILTPRRTHKEIMLKDNTIIPSNTIVATFIHFANYDEDLYKTPSKWDPEHFSERAIRKRPKTSQLSFGYGPRSCIGAKYAMLSMKIQMIHILRNYHLSTSVKELTKENLISDLSIRSKIGFPVKFTTRR